MVATWPSPSEPVTAVWVLNCTCTFGSVVPSARPRTPMPLANSNGMTEAKVKLPAVAVAVDTAE